MRLIDSTLMPQIERFLTSQNHPQAVRILSYLSAYGVKYSFCSFYSFEEKGDIVGVAVIRGDSVIGYFLKDSDDFISYCNHFSVTEVSTNCRLKSFPSFCENSGWIFYPPSGRSFREAFEPPELLNYQSAYRILKETFADVTFSFEDWYCDVCHMVRHGEGKLLGQEAQAVIFLVGLSSSLVIGEHLAVSPRWQRMGIGRDLLCNTVAFLQKNRKQLCCYSKNENSDSFYHSMGWIKRGKWYEYRREGYRQNEGN